MAVIDFERPDVFYGLAASRPAAPDHMGQVWISLDTGYTYLATNQYAGGLTWEWIGPNASNVDVLEIGSASYNTVQDVINLGLSAGLISGGDLTDNGDGTVDIAAGVGFIRSSDSSTAPLYLFNWELSEDLALTDAESNYIYIDYNSGTPQVAVTITGATVRDNERSLFELYEIVRDGTTLHITTHPQIAIDTLRAIQQWLYSVYKIKRADGDGGLIISETSTRNIAVTGGKIWIKLHPEPVDAIDTSGADTFDRYYQDGMGDWTKQSAQTQWDNAHYDDGSGTLATLSANRYSVQYFYMEADGQLVSLFGQAQYTVYANAEADAPPSSVPLRIEEHALLIGRVIFQQGASSAEDVQSSFTTQFASTTGTDHGNLIGLSDDDHTQYPLISSQAGVPASTPSRVGLVNVDTTNKDVYGGVGTASAADWKRLTNIAHDNVIYVGKHGNDSNEGTTEDGAKLTIGAGITAAVAAGAASNNIFTVQIIGGGQYVESVTCQAWVNIYGPTASIYGTLTGARCTVIIRELNSSNAPTVALTTAGITFVLDVLDTIYGNDANDVIDVNAAACGLYVRARRIETSGSGACFDNDAGAIVAEVGVVSSGSGEVYNVASGAFLWLKAASLSGTRTNAGTVSIISPDYSLLDYTQWVNSATQPPLNVTERSSAPSSPVTNDIYLDDGTNTASGLPGWRRYTGAAWEDVGATAGGTGSPTGSIIMYGGASAPSGWLLCDGSAVSRTTYADLYAITGDAFGNGDGSTTFNLPNMQSRSPIGVGTGSGLSTYAMGDTAGEESHVLLEAELAAHTHQYDGRTAPAGSGAANTVSLGSNTQQSDPTSTAAGSDTAHETRHPVLTVNFIIKT